MRAIGQAGYPLPSTTRRWQQASGTLLEPTQLFALLLGLLLLASSLLQFAVFKHDAYRSIALVCGICIFLRHYLVGERRYRLPRSFLISAAAFCAWGLLAASWASAWHQALLFALLPPLFFLSVPLLAVGWKTRPLAACLSLALLAITLFSADTVMTVASQIAGDTPYRMPWMSAVQAYLFYNSRDANQFHTLLIWSALPCLWLAPQVASKPLQRWLLIGLGLAIPALGLFLILNSQGDGALLAVLAGGLCSALVLRGPSRRALAPFAVGLGLGAAAFALTQLLGGSGLFGDVLSRNANEFSGFAGGRVHTWGQHIASIQRNGLWQGAGYRAIPVGSMQCDPHNVLVALAYWLGIPGLLLLGAWVSTLQWRLGRHPACVQILLPGTFTGLAVYQLVDAIWGFAPSLALLALLFASVCPLLDSRDPSWPRAVPVAKGWALGGIAIATAFFLLAQQPGFNAGHPARKGCLMAFGTTMQLKASDQPGSASKALH